LDQIVGRLFATRIFGPERAALLAAQLPATDAQAAADRDAQAAAIHARIGRIETAQNSQILELEELPANPADTATAAMRARIRARFAQLHEERERLESQLKTLAKATPAAADTTLLDQRPLTGDVLPALPPRLKARLFQAFDIAVLWNKPASQATVHAEITETTLQAVLAILDPAQDGYHDTGISEPALMGDLNNPVGRQEHWCRCGPGRGVSTGLSRGVDRGEFAGQSAAGSRRHRECPGRWRAPARVDVRDLYQADPR
jgi:hypothetical protein